MPAVVFSPAARAEFEEACQWYAARSPDLGQSLVAEIETTIRRIADAPQQFPVASARIRRARLHRFPYALFFHVAADRTVIIIACFHGSRDPRHWTRRV
jgi:plasmid stabilization system protein ParE